MFRGTDPREMTQTTKYAKVSPMLLTILNITKELIKTALKLAITIYMSIVK